jgi:hypothetical protein
MDEISQTITSATTNARPEEEKLHLMKAEPGGLLGLPCNKSCVFSMHMLRTPFESQSNSSLVKALHFLPPSNLANCFYFYFFAPLFPLYSVPPPSFLHLSLK